MKEELLIKFLRGECSPIEEQRVIQWLDDPASQQQLEQLMEKYWKYPSIPISDTTDYANLLDKIHKRVLVPTISRKNRFQSIVSKSLKIAATLFLAIFAAYFLTLSWLDNDKLEEVAVSNPVNRIERTTSIGEKLTLNMPDGTKIIVNSESDIQFNSDYGHSDRTVTLSGEAYFEVASDSLKPFKVETNGLVTVALGTSFNISTKHTSYQVALTDGKVAVGAGKESVELAPGQMAVWKSDQQVDAIKVQHFDQAKITAWKDGRLAFDRKQLGHILKDLEAWYGVTITIGPGVNSKQQVSGTFDNKNLKDILSGLSFTSDFSFELNEKQVKIKNNRL